MSEDLALQNIQSRVRMVVSYLMASLTPWSRDQNGFLLVLSTGNIDEALRGYYTKYDCSAGDLNPIGGINKIELKRFLNHFSQCSGFNIFDEISNAASICELKPIDDKKTNSSQAEEEMGMTYDELRDYGSLRMIERRGPVSMFEELLVKWAHKIDS